ncbi:ferritin family protein [Verrucomicrobiota bacterium]
MTINLDQLKDFEIVEFAILVEKRGAAFYDALAERNDMAAAANIFVKLASDEREHTREVAAVPVSRALSLIDKEEFYNSQFVEDIMGVAVFPDLKKLDPVLKGVKTPLDAVALGMKAEAATIAMYTAAAAAVSDKAATAALAGLVAIEKDHLRMLGELEKTLKEHCCPK